MIRVLVLLNSLAPYGAENFALNHVRHADRSRFHMVVAHMGGTTVLRKQFEAAGVEVIDLARGAKRRFSPIVFARLVLELRRRRIDLLQTHIGLSGIVGSVIGRLARVPAVVVTEQTTRSSYPGWFRSVGDLTFPLPHKHVYISRAVAADFAAVFPSASSADAPIIPNGIDVDGIAATAAAARMRMRASLGLDTDEFAFGNVGRLADQKGQRYLIEALPLVRAKYPQASAWIVGAGPLEAELRALAQSVGVTDAVHFLGQRMDVHELLGAFDAYVHPALFEGLGIAVLEAMAAGLPVIASAVDAIPEYVRDDQTGCLVAPRDSSALAAAMLRVLDDSAAAKAFGVAGQTLMRREYDIRAAVDAYQSLYEQTLKSAHG